jgi:hypothetical protein
MLLVIFGAGASYDSVPHLLPPTPLGYLNNSERIAKYGLHEEFRPPLANQLFDNRPSFVQVMQDYAACKPLVNLLRGEVQVERQLAKFEEEAKTFPIRNGQLAAIRYYLHQMLWSCEANWRGHHRGITNYLTFVDAINRWRYEKNEQICFVTFNYDTMLEVSLEDLWSVNFRDLGSYTSHPHFKLIKLHGSVDWGLEFESFQARFTTGQIISEFAAGNGQTVSQYYRKVIHPPVAFEGGSFGFPALAIPVEKKSQFVCPPEHLQALADVLPRVTKIITIGWRATEQHFLTMLKKPLTGLQGGVDLMIVSGDIKGVTETTANLGLATPASGHKYDTVDTGFSGLIKDISGLEAFLR